MTQATTCLLCDSEAEGGPVQGEGGNLTFYRCSNSDCGDYEISRRSTRDLEREEFKRQVQARAHDARVRGGYLSVTHSVAAGVTSKFVSYKS